uniref:Uncharacterized protein n=1 Tax=Desulfovibrio sp. U5L TaxID=596152 RepID=I2Q5E6_9BACT
MDQSDALRLISLVLLLAVVIVMRWWPWLNHRKFDWRLFKSGKRKKD